MGILGLVASVAGSFFRLIDNINISETEKLKLKTQAMEIQKEALNKALELQETIVKSQAGIIKAEARSESWLTRTWRPITMMIFVSAYIYAVIIAPIFQLPIPNDTVVNKSLDIIYFGLGGYVVGRSVEKSVREATLAVASIRGNPYKDKKDATHPTTSKVHHSDEDDIVEEY